jgi:hypothetical protein
LSPDVPVIDLGEVDAPRRMRGTQTSAPAKAVRFDASNARRIPSLAIYAEPPRSGLLASLSLFLPGAGQMLAREMAWGLFFLSSLGFLGALAWSIVVTIDRLMATLDLFELPPQGVLWVLPLLYISAATLHVWGVLHAHGLGSPWRREIHPFWSALASVLVPGWGQVLNGACGRAAVLLGSLWPLGAGGILISPLGRRTLSIVGLEPPLAARHGIAVGVLLAALVVVWAISVHDAAVLARVRRAR